MNRPTFYRRGARHDPDPAGEVVGILRRLHQESQTSVHEATAL